MAGEPRVARCGALVIVHHPEVPSETQAEREVSDIRALAGGDAVALLLVVDRVFPPPGASVREIYGRAVEHEPGIRAFGMLSEGIFAFGLSLTLSIVMQIFGGDRRVPHKVFSDRLAAVNWLGEHHDLQVDASEAVAAIEALRAR